MMFILLSLIMRLKSNLFYYLFNTHIINLIINNKVSPLIRKAINIIDLFIFKSIDFNYEVLNHYVL
jgi:hypothetical protein